MKRVNLRGRGITHVCYVESDTARDTEYQIGRKAGGVLACACMGYVFNKEAPKTCKHIGALALSSVAFDRQTNKRETPRAVISVGGETFTFKRAISFTNKLEV